MKRVHSDSHDSEDGEHSVKTGATETDDTEMEKFEKVVEIEEHREIIEEYRVYLKKFMAFSTIGKTYENFLILLSLFSCIQYIYSTYTAYIAEDTVAIFDTVEIVLAIIFSADWALCFFLADHKLMHFTDFYAMIDLLTVIPIWITRLFPCMDYNNIFTSEDKVVYILCGVTTTRILRSLRLRRKLLRIEDEVSRCIADIALNILVCMLFFCALMQFLETQDQPLEFHTWLYYILVTMATVGYGDIAPKSTLGRIAAMGMIAFAFISGPQMSSELIEKINQQSVYARATYLRKYRSKHVYICGEVQSMAVKDFVEELFHDDHEDDNIHAVVMSPDAPTSAMLQILRDGTYSLRVTFLEGSALSEKDLRRAKVREAVAIFIMTNKFTDDPDKQDAKTILQQFCLKKFVMREHTLTKPLFAIQLIRPENKRHLVDSSSAEGINFKEDIIICLNEIKMGIIAKAVMFPGTNTLLMNLLTSFADEDNVENELEAGENAEIENLDCDEQDNWIGEYQEGCGWEVYTTKLNPMFSGSNFAILAEILYQRIGTVLFGLLVEEVGKERGLVRMLLNPADYIIPSGGEAYVEAFVIAENKNSSDLTFPDDDEDGEENSSNGAINLARAAANLGITFGTANPRVHTSLFKKYSDVHPRKDEPSEKKELEWQSLLRRYNNKDSSQESQQEIVRKVEEEHMKANFYTVLSGHVDLEHCTIHTSVDIEAPYINQHTLIVGKALDNIFDLIRPLRAAYLGYIRPIVILTPTPISKHIWSKISIFSGIFVIYGSMLDEGDVIRSGIFKASQCIVLADNIIDSQSDSGMTAGAKAARSALLDSDAIFAYQCIKTMNPAISCCIEIINADNVGFLDPKEGLVSGDTDYKFTPQFASGALLTSSLLDTLICQAFYNKSIVAVIQLFAAGVDLKDKDTILAEIMGNRNVEPRKGINPIVGSALYQMKIPEVGLKTYGELFKFLVKDGMIPLGLYRGVIKNMGMGPKQNRLPYVFTNPPKETELFSCDKVFVLSQKPLMGKRTLTKRTDWALVRNLEADPMEILKRELRIQDQSQTKRMDKIEDKLDNLLTALKEIAGKPVFGFEERRSIARGIVKSPTKEGKQRALGDGGDVNLQFPADTVQSDSIDEEA